MFGMDKLSPNRVASRFGVTRRLVRTNDALGTLRFTTKGFFCAVALPLSQKVFTEILFASQPKSIARKLFG